MRQQDLFAFVHVCQLEVIVIDFSLQSTVSAKWFILAVVGFCSLSLFACG